jgi:hypothetical protein
MTEGRHLEFVAQNKGTLTYEGAKLKKKKPLCQSKPGTSKSSKAKPRRPIPSRLGLPALHAGNFEDDDAG